MSEHRRVKCFVRVRSCLSSEIDEPCCIAAGEDGRSVKVAGGSPATFDRVFLPETPLQDMCQECIVPAVRDSIAGLRSALMFYGQTGSGKTHTLRQLLPTFVRTLFAVIARDEDDYETTVTMDCVQVYLESVSDLFDTRRAHLQIREFSDTGVFVKGASELEVTEPKAFDELWARADRNRVVGSTALNDVSSRSHCVVGFNVTRRRRMKKEHFSVSSIDASMAVHHSSSGAAAAATLRRSPQCSTAIRSRGTDPPATSSPSTSSGVPLRTTGRFCFVDLAGSERLKKSLSQGIRKDEARIINQSLATLGNVMRALADPNATHIPYRDSKITRLLQESLGRGGGSSIIVNVAPLTRHASETSNALAFGQQCMRVVSVVTTWRDVDGKSRMMQAQDWLENRVFYLEECLAQQQEQLEAALRARNVEASMTASRANQSAVGDGGSASNDTHGQRSSSPPPPPPLPCATCAVARAEINTLQSLLDEARCGIDAERKKAELAMQRYDARFDSLNNDVLFYKSKCEELHRTPREVSDETQRRLAALQEYYEGYLAAEREQTNQLMGERDAACDEVTALTRQLQEARHSREGAEQRRRAVAVVVDAATLATPSTECSTCSTQTAGSRVRFADVDEQLHLASNLLRTHHDKFCEEWQELLGRVADAGKQCIEEVVASATLGQAAAVAAAERAAAEARGSASHAVEVLRGRVATAEAHVSELLGRCDDAAERADTAEAECRRLQQALQQRTDALSTTEERFVVLTAEHQCAEKELAARVEELEAQLAEARQMVAALDAGLADAAVTIRHRCAVAACVSEFHDQERALWAEEAATWTIITAEEARGAAAIHTELTQRRCASTHAEQLHELRETLSGELARSTEAAAVLQRDLSREQHLRTQQQADADDALAALREELDARRREEREQRRKLRLAEDQMRAVEARSAASSADASDTIRLLREEVAQLQEVVAKMTEDHQGEVHRLQRDASAQLTRERDEAGHGAAKLRQAQADIARLHDELATLEDTTEVRYAELQVKNAKLTAELQDVEQRAAHFEGQCSQKERQIRTLQNQLAERAASQHLTDDRVAAEHARAISLQQQVSDLAGQLETVTCERQALRSESQRWQQEAQKAQATVIEEAAAAAGSAHELQREIRGLRHEVGCLRGALEEQRVADSELRTALAAARDELRRAIEAHAIKASAVQQQHYEELRAHTASHQREIEALESEILALQQQPSIVLATRSCDHSSSSSSSGGGGGGGGGRHGMMSVSPLEQSHDVIPVQHEQRRAFLEQQLRVSAAHVRQLELELQENEERGFEYQNALSDELRIVRKALGDAQLAAQTESLRLTKRVTELEGQLVRHVVTAATPREGTRRSVAVGPGATSTVARRRRHRGVQVGPGAEVRAVCAVAPRPLCLEVSVGTGPDPQLTYALRELRLREDDLMAARDAVVQADRSVAALRGALSEARAQMADGAQLRRIEHEELVVEHEQRTAQAAEAHAASIAELIAAHEEELLMAEERGETAAAQLDATVRMLEEREREVAVVGAACDSLKAQLAAAQDAEAAATNAANAAHGDLKILREERRREQEALAAVQRVTGLQRCAQAGSNSDEGLRPLPVTRLREVRSVGQQADPHPPSPPSNSLLLSAAAARREARRAVKERCAAMADRTAQTVLGAPPARCSVAVQCTSPVSSARTANADENGYGDVRQTAALHEAFAVGAAAQSELGHARVALEWHEKLLRAASQVAALKASNISKMRNVARLRRQVRKARKQLRIQQDSACREQERCSSRVKALEDKISIELRERRQAEMRANHASDARDATIREWWRASDSIASMHLQTSSRLISAFECHSRSVLMSVVGCFFELADQNVKWLHATYRNDAAAVRVPASEDISLLSVERSLSAAPGGTVTDVAAQTNTTPQVAVGTQAQLPPCASVAVSTDPVVCVAASMQVNADTDILPQQRAQLALPSFWHGVRERHRDSTPPCVPTTIVAPSNGTLDGGWSPGRPADAPVGPDHGSLQCSSIDASQDGGDWWEPSGAVALRLPAHTFLPTPTMNELACRWGRGESAGREAEGGHPTCGGDGDAERASQTSPQIEGPPHSRSQIFFPLHHHQQQQKEEEDQEEGGEQQPAVLDVTVSHAASLRISEIRSFSLKAAHSMVVAAHCDVAHVWQVQQLWSRATIELFVSRVSAKVEALCSSVAAVSPDRRRLGQEHLERPRCLREKVRDEIEHFLFDRHPGAAMPTPSQHHPKAPCPAKRSSARSRSAQRDVARGGNNGANPLLECPHGWLIAHVQ